MNIQHLDSAPVSRHLTARPLDGAEESVQEPQGTVHIHRGEQVARNTKNFLVHLLAGDLVSTAASMVPLFTSLQNPIAKTAFVAGQLLGVALDTTKTVYGFKRKGQQSAS